MNTMKYRLFILFLLLCTPGLRAQEGADSLAQQPVAATTDAVAAATPEALWDLANTAYINGDYRTATETYERILDEGLSSVKLYYNLANACFKEDRLGKAILYYHRALREAPGSNDIRYNLSVAEARTKDNIAQIPAFFLTQWLRDIRHAMSCTAWTVLSLAALAIALTALLLFLLAQRMRPRKAGFYTTLAAAVVFLLASWFAAGERREMLDDTQAVVMNASAVVKSSPDKSSTDLFVLHEGTLVEISGELDNWCEITIADGKKGWIEQRAIERI